MASRPFPFHPRPRPHPPDPGSSVTQHHNGGQLLGEALKAFEKSQSLLKTEPLADPDEALSLVSSSWLALRVALSTALTPSATTPQERCILLSKGVLLTAMDRSIEALACLRSCLDLPAQEGKAPGAQARHEAEVRFHLGQVRGLLIVDSWATAWTEDIIYAGG